MKLPINVIKRCKAKVTLLFTVVVLAISCANKKDSAPPLFTLVEQSGINFRNDVKDTKEDNSFLFRNFYNAGMRDVDINKWTIDEKLKGGGNHLYQNQNGRYIEVTKEAGLHTGVISFGLGVTISDINGDDYPDIYVGNDFY